MGVNLVMESILLFDYHVASKNVGDLDLHWFIPCPKQPLGILPTHASPMSFSPQLFSDVQHETPILFSLCRTFLYLISMLK